MVRIKKINLLFVLILLLAFGLRFYGLDRIPSGFHSDEAAFGYNAYSLLETGKDEYGVSFPLILESFRDYKGAVYAYLTIPFIKLLGLNEFAVRAPTAILGVIFVGISYLLSLQLTKNKKIAILTAAFCAINPLSILLSRVQSDPLVSVVFILTGLYLFLLWVEKKNSFFLIFTLLFWTASFFTYPSPRIFLPITIFVLLLFYGKSLLKDKRYLFVPVFLLIFALDIFLYFGQSGSRFRQLSVFNTPTVKLVLEEKIREDGLSSALTARFFHNKPMDYSLFFAKNYFDYFSFDFLFLKGGQPDREIVPSSGLFYLIELPLFLAGAFLIIRRREKWGVFVLGSIVLLPLGLALAVDESPNVHRFFLLVFFIEMVVAFGALEVFTEIKKRRVLKYALPLTGIFLIFNIIYFLHQLFVHQPVHRPWYRGYAYKALAENLQRQDQNYQKFLITKTHASPYIYFLFYSKYDPVKYQAEGSPGDLIEGNGFGKYSFTSLDCPFADPADNPQYIKPKSGVLYVNRGTCPLPKKNARLIETIKWNDGSDAFQLLKYAP
ncbi:MAG: hypothetical protein A2186_00650 [Candidatus Levybacteria bacterium RIFOXYA1_FULL_41_10]|nr:MAG: hypothetical protein US02_C0011G0015 [Candidatus Levybacteria bacterium GW2011_GWA2_36_13]KKQ00429.1 MAG: hypothetical protein US07_C0012G0002 [Candidatus Levybacteria bacterium GW2011_GWB1_36_18]KKR16101.1 MAG: hypothetical protein UT44_C0019G0007 [Candidatus Levybacteria bacterium GW2011_GWA1_39_32]KKR51138.1 MAG: hypothetical protein UT87_C0008G0016 [Candidatus Levybacteria bacterium GW2011_GWC1_40_19]KKR73438.1 MAG: hypothetical protein UU15_C0010G0008 [Candidatus Levybacteria bacte